MMTYPEVFLAPVGQSDRYKLYAENGDRAVQDRTWLALIALMSVHFTNLPNGQNNFFKFTNEILLESLSQGDEGEERKNGIDGATASTYIPDICIALAKDRLYNELTNRRLQLVTNAFKQGSISLGKLVKSYDDESRSLELTKNLVVLDKEGHMITANEDGAVVPLLNEEQFNLNIPQDSDWKDPGYIKVSNVPDLTHYNYRLDLGLREYTTPTAIYDHRVFGEVDAQGNFIPFMTVLDEASIGYKSF